MGFVRTFRPELMLKRHPKSTLIVSMQGENALVHLHDLQFVIVEQFTQPGAARVALTVLFSKPRMSVLYSEGISSQGAVKAFEHRTGRCTASSERGITMGIVGVGLLERWWKHRQLLWAG